MITTASNHTGNTIQQFVPVCPRCAMPNIMIAPCPCDLTGPHLDYAAVLSVYCRDCNARLWASELRWRKM